MSVNTLTFEQCSTVLNSLVKQATGAQVITASTPGDFISVAQHALNTNRDAVFNALGDVIARTVFSIRPYNALFRGLEKDLPRWGAYMRKLSIADNDWQDDAAYKWPATYDASQTPPTGNGQTIDQWKIKKPDLLQTNFYGTSVYQDNVTIFEDQLETAFRGPEEFGSFLSMITGNISDKLEQSRETMARGLVSNLIGALIAEANSSRVVHLLTEYNTLCGFTTPLTAQTVYQPANFGPFMKWVYSRIAQVSELFKERSYEFQTVINTKKIYRHTPYENQKLYMYSPARQQIDARVIADTYHDNYLKYADVETVPFWQSILTPDSIAIKPVYTSTTGTVVSATNTTEQAGIFALLFDEDALGYAVLDRRVIPTPVNANGLYRNLWVHAKQRCFMDNTEKAVVFLLD